MGQAQRRDPCRNGEVTLAALPRGLMPGEGLREPRRPRLVGVRGDARAPASASRARSGGSSCRRRRAPASAAGSPAGTTSPLRPWRTSPPAAAPTASVAMTAKRWFMASLATSPHGSRNGASGIDGMTRTSAPAEKLRKTCGSTRAGGVHARRPAPRPRRAPRRPGRAPRRGARSPAARHAIEQFAGALLARRSADEQRPEGRRALGPADRRRPERVVDRLRRDRARCRRPVARGVGARRARRRRRRRRRRGRGRA